MIHNCTLMVDTVGKRNVFCSGAKPQQEEKLKAAIAYLGDKWVLHKKHAPKHKNPAKAAPKFFLGV